ncbi:MAG: GIY-YIG nuclease family protein [Nitrososphaerota archaeon]|nr:GIY-YIG nuclease family protein [Nitrososphaerota archaeon]MDG7052072.1 GIY-YIG nuclease family protein [Nitrososphaerota archaeon]
MFSDLVDMINQAKVHEQRFVLWPQQWQTYTKSHQWRIQRLEESKKEQIPDVQGIYSLIIQPNIANHDFCSYLMYIGQSNSLRRRFNEYLTKEKEELGRPKIIDFLKRYNRYIWFCYTTDICGTLTDMEEALLSAFIPPLNSQIKGIVGKVVRAL